MKIIGLIGGMSWESTVEYYRIINETIRKKLGKLYSAKCILYSVEFNEIEKYQSNGEWQKSAAVLIDAAKSLELAGADYILICTNTMHKVYNEVKNSISIPILHIADLTIEKLKKDKIKKIALLGTKYTMKEMFYKERIIDNKIDVLIPNEEDMRFVNNVIYDELCCGIIKEESKKRYIEIINKLIAQGAEGVILGCTEIGLLINENDVDIPVYDTTYIHAQEAALMSI